MEDKKTEPTIGPDGTIHRPDFPDTLDPSESPTLPEEVPPIDDEALKRTREELRKRLRDQGENL